MGSWFSGLTVCAAEIATFVSPSLGRSIYGSDPGTVLLSELNCVACHEARKTGAQWLHSREGPHLGPAGLYLTSGFLREFLDQPASQLGRRAMPDMLHGFDARQRRDIVESLVHYLRSIQPPPSGNAVEFEAAKAARGEVLFHQIGCVACHAPEGAKDPGSPFAGLARKTTVGALASFLKAPLHFRPSGRMPSMKLTRGEAAALAMYLMRAQATGAGGPEVQRIAGLRYTYFEWVQDVPSRSEEEAGIVDRFASRFPGNLSRPLKRALRVVDTGTAAGFDLSARRRDSFVAFLFTGRVTVERGGDYVFYTASDDGSRLYVGGQLVVRNDGEHGTTEAKGTVHLEAGDHPIAVTYFNRGGGLVLRVSYQGPGMTKREIPDRVLSHEGYPMQPLGDQPFAVDPVKARAGERYFVEQKCIACHRVEPNPGEPSELEMAKPLDQLALETQGGCLRLDPADGLPRYRLSPEERHALGRAIRRWRSGGGLTGDLSRIDHTMNVLDCYGCHARNGAGGPDEKRRKYFRTVGKVDLGDEGRFPPDLSGVGAKLRPAWLTQVLDQGGSVRPYMATRMPRFGKENVKQLAQVFLRADRTPPRRKTPAESEADLLTPKYGRKLVGVDGLSCITCHRFGPFNSLGVPALDLTTTTVRLQQSWFRRYLMDPQSLRPGTRMPAFWPNGQSVNSDILGGNVDRQIDAIWSYLKLADKNNPPEGLVHGTEEIVAEKEAVIYRNFIQGCGPRGIGVGYPEKANLAFDAGENRLAMIWQGAFIDAARHSHGRGSGFEPPLGHNLYALPPGPPFAFLADAGDPWPARTGHEGGYRFRGYHLDKKRRPAFDYRFRGIRIEDYFVPVAGELDASFRRYLKFSARARYVNLYYRAAVGHEIQRLSDGAFLVDQRIKLRFPRLGGGSPIVRTSEGNQELIVPIVFRQGSGLLEEEMIW